MTYLTRDMILNAIDVETKDVNVPEWGGIVKIKALTAKERDRYEATLCSLKGKNISYDTTNARAKLAALCIVGDDNKPLFTAGDVEALGSKSAKAIDRIYSVCQDLNGISDKDIEELEKN